ncbi:MAG: elongation factor P, partial [Candidatus Aminicenantes bacterium]|nr:elongation factor P [Candidatus Aminicenantes bacterium]
MIIVIDGELYRITDTTHVTPGKGNAIMQTKLRKLKDL